MNTIANWLGAAALIAAPAIGCAADIVTYDFTGTVISGAGAYFPISAGTAVTGTIAIDLSAGNASLSTGTFGSMTSQWLDIEDGGTVYGLPAVSAPVFTSTLQFPGISYGPSSPSSIGSGSTVEGASITSSSLPDTWGAIDTEYSTLTSYTLNEINLYGGTGRSAPFNAAGLPILANATSQFDRLISSDGNRLEYTITSLTLGPLPEPSIVWLLVGGLGGLAIFRRARS